MTANPVELIGGLATASNVTKADIVSWAKARVAQVMADAPEIRSTTLALQLLVILKTTATLYLQDTTDTTTADDGVNVIVSSDGKRFKRVAGSFPSLTMLGSTSGSTTLTPQAVASGALLLPAASDTLVGRATTDTLTNKTINAASNSISNLATAMFAASVVDTDGTLAANSATRLPAQSAVKAYVDSLVNGLKWKASVLCATTANISLSGEQTIDGVLTSASRVLVKNQTTASQNGIYLSAGGPWTRAVDADSSVEITQATVFVQQGTAAADTQWTCTTDNITIGTTSLTFAQVTGGGGTYSAGSGLTLTGTVFSVDGAITGTLAGTQTYTGQKTFSASIGFGGQTSPAAPIHAGTAALLSTGANIASARANTGTANVHGIAENSTYNLGAAGLGVAAFDAISTFSGTQTYDHTVSFQSRPTYGSSGTITNIYGSWDQPTVNTGTASNRYGHDVEDAVGTGAVTTQYGYYCASLTKAGTNWAFFSAGTTPSKFGGNVDVNGLSLAGVDVLGAWSAYTPSVAAQTGAFTTTSATGRFKQHGKTVFFSVQLVITTNGTAAGYVILGLPVAAKQVSNPGITFSGIRSGLIGLTAIIDTTTTIDVVDVTGVYPGASGRTLYITGSYEAA